jgi:hypothetical protein
MFWERGYDCSLRGLPSGVSPDQGTLQGVMPFGFDSEDSSYY